MEAHHLNCTLIWRSKLVINHINIMFRVHMCGILWSGYIWENVVLPHLPFIGICLGHPRQPSEQCPSQSPSPLQDMS